VGGAGGRIERLCRRHERRARDAFAAALEQAVEDVDRPPRRGGAAIPIDRPAVAEAAPTLLRLAGRLRGTAPMSAETMRLTRSLVSDGAGPLYARSTHRSEYPPGTLGQAARTIIATCEERTAQPVRQPGELAPH
jgi:hypothetical protein